MMERLTGWLTHGEDRYAVKNMNISKIGQNACLEKLAEYEDLEEHGLLVRLPCKVGDTVYQADANRIYELKIKNLLYDTDGICFDERAIGKTVFLTREEAEAALEKMGEKT